MRRTTLLTILLTSVLFVGVRAQDRVLAWYHTGPAASMFRVTVNETTLDVSPADLRIRPSDGRHEYPLADGVLQGTFQAIVEACNAIGVCAPSEPLVIPPPNPPTNLQVVAPMLGNGVPTTPIPPGGGDPPAAPTSPSPANGATGVSVTPTLTAVVGSDFTNCKIRFDDVNPPVDEFDLGTSCQYNPATLPNSVTRYWRLILTNQFDQRVGDVWSFTTEPTTAPPPDPDPGCASKTPSSTGYNYISFTSCRQDAMYAAKANYDANPSAPTQRSGQWYKLFRELADNNNIYGDRGQYDAWMLQATGDCTYATRANGVLAEMEQSFAEQEALPGFPAPYDFLVADINGNNLREQSIRWVRLLDVIRPCLAGAVYDAYTLRLNRLLQAALMDGYTKTLSLADSDQAVGVYFGVVMQYLIHPTNQLAIDNFNNVNPVNPAIGNKIGGLTPTKTVDQYLAGSDNVRNAIQFYVALSGGNGWIESREYDYGTLNLVLEGYDAVLRKTGVDYFPEITAMLEPLAARILHDVTPNLRKPVQWGDTESANTLEKSHEMILRGNLAGLLRGTTAGRKLHDQINDMVTEFGSVDGFNFRPHHHPFWIYDPTDTPVEWRDGTLGFVSYGARQAVTKSFTVSPDASQFSAFYGGPIYYSAATNAIGTVQHLGSQFGDWNLWRCASAGSCDWAITGLRDYGGPHVFGADAGNTPLMHGWAGLNWYAKFDATQGSDYFYVAGTQGGGIRASKYCGTNNTPDIYVHEWTREQVVLFGPTDTVVTFDRANVLDTVPEQTCYTAADLARMATFNHHKMVLLHTHTSPTLNANVFSFQTKQNEAGRYTVGFPGTFAHTIVDENDGVTPIVATSGKYSSSTWQRRYHIRVYPTNTDQWKTFLTVTDIGASPAPLTFFEDAGKVQGVHIKRTAGNVVLTFNSEQGAALNTTYRHASHNDDLDVVRFRETGFTFTFTPTTSTTVWIPSDLNPANTWTYTLDGGAAQAISEDSKGQARIALSATANAAHTIVVSAK